MAQMIQQQLSDQTSGVNGTVTFTYTPAGAGAHQWDDFVVAVSAAAFASGAYSVALTRSDASTVAVQSLTGLAAGATDYRLSVGTHVNANGGAAGTPLTIPAVSKSLVWSATAAGGGTVRMTIWGVKYQGT